VGLAALLVDQTEPGAAFALLPADHVIADGEGFRKVLAGAFELLSKMIIWLQLG
jgi:mannose-1-phosphate guanylyltransferase